LMYNNTLHHAIAPLDSGTRYSLIFFYDEYHPSVAHLNGHDVNVTLMNYWFDEPVSLYLTNQGEVPEQEGSREDKDTQLSKEANDLREDKKRSRETLCWNHHRAKKEMQYY
jgi:hypothetical protein